VTPAKLGDLCHAIPNNGIISRRFIPFVFSVNKTDKQSINTKYNEHQELRINYFQTDQSLNYITELNCTVYVCMWFLNV